MGVLYVDYEANYSVVTHLGPSHHRGPGRRTGNGRALAAMSRFSGKVCLSELSRGADTAFGYNCFQLYQFTILLGTFYLLFG